QLVSSLLLRPCRRPACSRPVPYTTLFRSHFLAAPPHISDSVGGACGQIAHRRRTHRSGSLGAEERKKTDMKHIKPGRGPSAMGRSEEHTSELQSRFDLVCRLLLEKKNVRS